MRTLTKKIVLGLLLATGACGDPEDDAPPSSETGSETSPESTSAGETGEGGPTADAGSASSGATAANGTEDSGGLSPTQACEAYLACAAATTPGELGPLLETYGPDGSCWSSTPAVAEQCDMACEVGLMQLGEGFPDEPRCEGTASTSGPGTGSDESGSSGERGEQPEDGVYSHCMSAAECTGANTCITVMKTGDGFCTNMCEVAGDCPAAPGETAAVVCIPVTTPNLSFSVCALNCSSGEQCPTGMTCSSVQESLVCV